MAQTRGLIWWGLVWACLACAGCGSLLHVTSREPAPIPVEPRPSAELAETISEQAAYAADVLGRVLARGAQAGNAAVEQATRAARLVESYLGSPARRLALPPAQAGRGTQPEQEPGAGLAPCADFERAYRAAEKALLAYRKDLAAHARDLDARRNEQMGVPRETRISSGWLAWLSALGPVGIIALAALALALGGRPALALLRSAWGLLKSVSAWLFTRSARALDDVVEGIERAKARMPDEAAEALREELLAVTTPETRATIDRAKVGIKERLRGQAAGQSEAGT